MQYKNYTTIHGCPDGTRTWGKQRGELGALNCRSRDRRKTKGSRRGPRAMLPTRLCITLVTPGDRGSLLTPFRHHPRPSSLRKARGSDVRKSCSPCFCPVIPRPPTGSGTALHRSQEEEETAETAPRVGEFLCASSAALATLHWPGALSG